MNSYSQGLRIILLVVFVLSLAGTGGVRAAPQDVTITVTTLEDEYQVDGDCSLREAMHAANYNEAYDQCPTGDSVGTDSIVFASGGTIVLGYYLNVVDGGPLTIDSRNAITISGNNATNIFEVESGAELTLRNLTITAGYITGFDVGGGALYNDGGTVTIDGCSFMENNASGENTFGGAIHNNEGSVTILNATFTGNSAGNSGGAIHTKNGTIDISNSTFQDNVAFYSGGAFSNISGTATIFGTTFDSNLVYWDGGAIYCGGCSSTVEASAFTGNVAFQDGGAISSGSHELFQLDGSWFSENAALNDGGAIYINYSPDFNITNTTFYSNTAVHGGGLSVNSAPGTISDSLFRSNNAEQGGGIYNFTITFADSGLSLARTTLWENNAISGGAIYNDNAQLMMTNDTLASNTADSGGGAYNTGGGLLEILNSTLAHNIATTLGDQLYRAGGSVYTANSIYAYGGSGQNCYGSVMDSGNNLDSGDTCAFSAAGSMSNTDPLLGPLQDNNDPDRSPGYPTLTCALHYPSPAISHADASQCPGIDQRGYVRRSGYCDIGAYEAQPYTFYVNSGDWQSTDINTYFPNPLVMEAQDYYGNRLAGVDVTFSGPDSGASLANNHTSLITAADGFASFSALANGIPGGWYEVDALHTFSSLYTTFHLMNLSLPGEVLNFFLPMVKK